MKNNNFKKGQNVVWCSTLVVTIVEIYNEQMVSVVLNDIVYDTTFEFIKEIK